MIHKILKRVRVNFRQSSSDRKATLSYRNYHKRIIHLFKNFPIPGKNKGEIINSKVITKK